MSVFTRADSPWFWLWLEPVEPFAGEKVRTAIRCDGPSTRQRKDNRALAEQLYHVKMSERARGLIAPEAKPARTFAEQAAWFTTHLLPHRKGKEREALVIPKLVAVFGPLPLSAITRTLVTQGWVTPRLTTPTTIKKAHRTAARSVQAGPRTVNREVGVLKAIMQSAVPDYLAQSPLYGMKLLETTTPQRRLMTRDEEARLLKVLAPDDKALFLLGLDSLVRLTDLLDLKRTDDKGSRMWIGDPKAGGGFAVPISRRARKALDAWYAASADTRYIFARRRHAETERDRRGVIRKMLARACASATPPIPYGRTTGGLTFHWATRRTGATRMLTNQVDLGTVQKVGRWKTPDVVLSIYHELLDDQAQNAVDTVGNRAGIGKPKRHRSAAKRHRATKR